MERARLHGGDLDQHETEIERPFPGVIESGSGELYTYATAEDEGTGADRCRVYHYRLAEVLSLRD